MNCVTTLLLNCCSLLIFLRLCTAAPAPAYSFLKAESLKNDAENAKEQLNSVMLDFNCTFCKEISSILETFLMEDGPKEDVARFVAGLCIYMKMEDENVCNLVVEEFKEEILTIAYIVSFGRAKLACAILLGPSCEPLYYPWNQTEWNVTIPSGKPPVATIPDPKVYLQFLFKRNI